MRRWNRIAGIIAAAGLCWMTAGCSSQTGGDARSLPYKESFVQAQTETEVVKPTQPDPSEIEPFPDGEKEVKAEPLKGGKRIVIMTDIHYLASSLTDKGDMFQSMVEHGDGKLTNYVWEITDAALEEVQLLSPDVLVLSGDLTLQGEKKSHGELAKKLEEVEKNGTAVVVIPGNHDINNHSAAVYSGGDRYPAEPTTPEDFARIYGRFGYEEAYSRDGKSLSYTYDLDPSMRLLMLDTCQYTPRNRVGGMIKTETYEWIEKQLADAREQGVILLPIAHHNLLDQSKVYVDDCTIEHSSELIDMLESENIPLFLSGHLHVQHFMQNNDIGIYEIVTSSLSTPPCQYGVLEYMENESFSYYTKQVDIEKWARKHQMTDENLLNFNTYSPPSLNRIFYNQAYDAMKNSREEETGDIFVQLTETEKQQMSRVYADINSACYGGKAYQVVEEAVKQPGYKLWQEYCYPIIPYEYLEYIVEDAVKDYNYLSVH
ncbi:MAG: metallophosphoesterase [Clostridium sp.]|nr:metallophosphoesterase [Clostridium sp.]